MFETSKIHRKDNPRETAGVFSLLTFLYTRDIFKMSKHREIEEDDVYNTVRNCLSDKLGDALEKPWNRELKSGRKSLIRALWTLVGWEYAYYGFLNLVIRTPLATIAPYATGILVSYFESGSNTTQEKAMICGAVLIACGILNALYNNFYFVVSNRLGLQIELSLCSLMYRKALKLSTKSLCEVTNGRIVAMMAQDSITASTASVLFLSELWIGLLQVAIILGVMYYRIGSAALVGIGFLMAVIPLQFWLYLIQKQIYRKTLALTDKRLRKIREIMVSIKLIKMCCWEKYFNGIVRTLRINEVSKMRIGYFVTAIMFSLAALSYRISYFLCIFAYYMLGNNISAEELFFLITCYKYIDGYMNSSLPSSFIQLARGKSALERIRKYLLMEEIGERFVTEKESWLNDNEGIKEGNVNMFRDGQEMKVMEGSTKKEQQRMKNLETKIQHVNLLIDRQTNENFEGVKSEDEDAHLLKSRSVKKEFETRAKIIFEHVTALITNKLVFKDVNLELSETSLIGVTGGVGSGKTTFIKLCLNDTQPSEGRVLTTGCLSYASQEPWLFPGTIRQNILFGNVFDSERYHQVLKVCALMKDLEGFPERDLTVVNDKGLNLSGGQQARINLARAVYIKADIYLLDDVLSSLDLNVSKYIFKHCIQEFLRGKICLLVSQNADFLLATDKVLTMKDDGIQMSSNETKLEGLEIDKDGEDVDISSKLLGAEVPYVKLYKEHKVAGKVEWKDYRRYFDFAGGWMVVSVVVAICFATQYVGIKFDYYANQWLEVETKVVKAFENQTNEELDSELASERRSVLLVYVAILVVFVICIFVEYFSFFAVVVRASRNMHLVVFEKIMGATMEFFDSHYSGSIVNRLSKDMAHVDEALGGIYFESIKNSFELAITVSLILYQNPMLCAPAFLFLLAVLYGGSRFLRSSRSLRRVEPIVRAPCIGYINASLDGLSTIRASGNQTLLHDQFDKHQDHYGSVVYMMFMSKHAFGLWLDLLGSFFSTCIIFSFIIFHDKIENVAGDVGVAVTQAIGLSSVLQNCVFFWAEVENSMTAAERVLEYGDAKQEKSMGENPARWPEETKIEYKNVSLEYSISDSKILKEVTFMIEPKQKVGIVGRTGAGKSSIISVLFRLYEPSGAILINDWDISKLKLHTLRSKISIIPQDPVMFKGSIRSNLDPEERYTDLDLWNALDKVGLKTSVFGIGLSYEVEEGGLNFSIGQRQLFSLARVVLSDNKIVVFDEATANMDPETDDAIREVIEVVFAECTIITIAHKIKTVIRCDKIVVVEGGEIVEFDAPEMLLKKPISYFNSILK